MKNLAYQTRGTSRAEGKEKVYFTCHPKDFSLYFKEVTDSILAYQNCAVWYFDGTEEERKNEEHLKRLRDMQLLVVPVTYRFLCDTECGAHAEFAYAKAHHIPILPLMQEAGLEQQFNRVCGELHVLSRFASGGESKYRVNLEKFLSDVLVGDALAEQIRAAFDAYIFLSYRKKDSAYAEQLMELVYENEACRDIALWYDEYLTPGEDFNDSIRAALEKSSLFLLAVTPNLLEKMNYVMQDEYPMAKNTGKYIFPVELVETDRKLLADFYEEIPDLVPVAEQERFREAFLSAIRTIASEERDNSPEHNFFIGLAYLDGIDVPKNSGRALELITDAAEQGVELAVKKLTMMYQYGKGCERDVKKSCQWAEKLTEICENRYVAEPNQNVGMELLDSYIRVSHLYEQMGEIAQAGEQLQLANNHSIEMVERFGTDGTVIRCAHMQILAAEWDKKNWDFEAAREKLERTKEFVRQMMKTNRTPAVEELWAETMELLGDLDGEDKVHAAAVSYYEEALDMAKPQMENGEMSVYSYCGVLRRLACAQLKNGDVKEANSNFRKVLSLAKKSYEEYRTPDMQYLLCLGYAGVADVYKENRPQEALKWLEKELKEARNLAEKTDERSYLRLIFSATCDICEILTKRNPKEGLTYVDEMISVAERLAQDSDDPEAKRDLWIAHRRKADLYKALQEPKLALESFSVAYESLKSLSEWKQDPDSAEHLMQVCCEMGELLQEMGNKEQARHYYQEAECCLDAMISYYEDSGEGTISADAEEKLERFYFTLWELYLTVMRVVGPDEEIRRYVYAAYRLGEKIAGRFDPETELFLSARTYQMMGIVKRDIQYMEEALHRANQLSLLWPSPAYEELVANVEMFIRKWQ